ncbi:MAG: hypothetical protein ACI909_004274 [Planctomycetota bacterium]|jgi:hypothetical protein
MRKSDRLSKPVRVIAPANPKYLHTVVYLLYGTLSLQAMPPSEETKEQWPQGCESIVECFEYVKGEAILKLNMSIQLLPACIAYQALQVAHFYIVQCMLCFTSI